MSHKFQVCSLDSISWSPCTRQTARGQKGFSFVVIFSLPLMMCFHSSCEDHFNWLLEFTRVLVLRHATEDMHCVPWGVAYKQEWTCKALWDKPEDGMGKKKLFSAIQTSCWDPQAHPGFVLVGTCCFTTKGIPVSNGYDVYETGRDGRGPGCMTGTGDTWDHERHWMKFHLCYQLVCCTEKGSSLLAKA